MRCRVPLLSGSIVDLRRGRCHCSDFAAECAADLQRVRTGSGVVAPARIRLRSSGGVSNCKRLRSFRVMTKDRREIVIEASADGLDWRPYEFKWKPGDVMRPAGWCAPHQPRLDWQMWFAALGSYRQNPWFVQTVICLLHGKLEVVALFERNPFPQAPPRYVRATLYRYRFTTAEEHRETGAWWKRQELGEYLPSVSLEDVR